jgi:hypothetical protein
MQSNFPLVSYCILLCLKHEEAVLHSLSCMPRKNRWIRQFKHTHNAHLLSVKLLAHPPTRARTHTHTHMSSMHIEWITRIHC